MSSASIRSLRENERRSPQSWRTDRVRSRCVALPPSFFRVVSVGELADWRTRGRLGPGPSGMEGKQRQDGIGPAYFADEDALKLVAGIREVKALQRYEPEQNG